MFFKSLKMELYRLSKSPMLYFSILIGIVISVWLFIVQLQDHKAYQEAIIRYGKIEALYYPESLYNHFIGLDHEHGQPKILYTILPILSSLPFSASYCIDRKTGYIQNIVTRVPLKAYQRAKLTVTFFSGFIVTFTILIFSLVLTSTVFPALPPETIAAKFSPAYENMMMQELFLSYPLLYTVIYIIIDSCFMGLVALLSLCIGIFISQPYISITSGTIAFYAVSFLFSTLQLFTANPYIFLIPEQYFTGISMIVIVGEFLIALISGLIAFRIKEGNKDVLSI